MRFELVDCEATILREIADPKMTRRDVAQTYHLARRSMSHPTFNERFDWQKVNQAIMDRWSKAGLIWIKQQAANGKCFEKPYPHNSMAAYAPVKGKK